MTAIDDAFNAALARFHGGRDFADLSARDQLLVCIWGVEADVNNGGFDQFFFNTYGGMASEASAALRAIGASQMAEIVDEAIARFGPGWVPQDRDARLTRLLALTEDEGVSFDDLDRRFWAYPDDVAALLGVHLGHSLG